jgi:hypothetical protein
MLNANHEFKFGVEWDWNQVENVTRSIGDVEIRFRNGAADEVRLRNTPLISKEAVNQFAFYVDDIVNVVPGSLEAGLGDSYEGYLPNRTARPGPGSAQGFPEAKHPRRQSFAPRSD